MSLYLIFSPVAVERLALLKPLNVPPKHLTRASYFIGNMSYVKESTMPGKDNYGYIFDQTVLVWVQSNYYLS